MKRAYSYIRFSEKRQASGDSLRRQLEGTEAYCERHGLALDRELRFQDLGMSAFKGKNGDVGALAAFREAVSTGRVPKGSVLIIENLDRLTREEIDEALELFLGLLRAGVEIVTLQPERHYTRGSTKDVVGLLEPLFIMSRAHEESATKSARVRASWEAKRRAMAEKPATTRCPAWLQPKEDGSGFDPVPWKVEAVLRIYELARDGYGVRQITQRLNRERVPAIGGRREHWVPSYVQKILKSRAVLGECQPYVTEGGKLVPYGRPVKGYYPPIMSEKEWRAARQAAKSRRLQKGPHGINVRSLFTGILFDARDGCTMIVKRHSAKDPTNRLISSGAVYRGGKGPRLSFHYERLEHEILNMLGCKYAGELLRKGPKNREQEIGQLAGELVELDRRIRAAQKRLATDPKFEELVEGLALLRDEKDRKSEELEALRRQQASNDTETRGEAMVIIRELLNCPPEDLADLRTRLKARIRALVSEVWLLVEGTRTKKLATVQVFFRNGKWIGRSLSEKPFRPPNPLQASSDEWCRQHGLLVPPAPGSSEYGPIRHDLLDDGAMWFGGAAEKLRPDQDLRRWRELDSPPSCLDETTWQPWPDGKR